MEALKRLAREPLIHFLLIGTGIYLLYGWSTGGDTADDERTVTVSAGDIQSLSDQWRGVWNRPPTQGELANIIQAHVRVQILHREALAMGLDVGDVVIERRLAQKLELLAQGLITPAAPSDDTLQAWYAEHEDQFEDPDLYTITQIFFDPDKRGDSTLVDAEATLVDLQSLTALPESLDGYGDRFMLQNYYPSRSALELRKLFGQGFTDQIEALEASRWHGPVLSGYGVHLVMIHDVVRSVPPAFEEVRDEITERWMAEQVDELSGRFLDELIARYIVVMEEVVMEEVVEQTNVPTTVPGGAQ